MVLRRPYAFLIKHFKLIHLLIAAFFAYLAFASGNLYKYLNLVINETAHRHDALSYVNGWMFLFIFLSLVLCIIIFWLFKYKNKPRKMYIITIVGYVIVGLFLGALFIYMQSFPSAIPETKTIRFYRDTLTIVLAFQYIFTILMLIRGLGFDIKKFNFASDVQELNLSASDSEEIEINTQIDTTNIVRGFRKQQREFSYFYKEFKVIILVILAIVLIVVGYKAYNYFTDNYKVYKENDIVGSINNVKIKNSYYASDKKGDYMIVEFEISKKGQAERLNSGNMTLYVGNKKYIPDKNICYKFTDLGQCYKKQYINNEPQSFIFTYHVSEIRIKNVYVMYSDSFDKVFKVKLTPKEA